MRKGRNDSPGPGHRATLLSCLLISCLLSSSFSSLSFSQPTSFTVKIRFGRLDTTCYPSCIHPSEWRVELFADIYDQNDSLILPSSGYYYNWGVDFCQGFNITYGWYEGSGQNYVAPDGNKKKSDPGCCAECPFQTYQVRVKVTIGDETEASDIVRIPDIAIPASTELSQNYPNPFNPATTIPFRLQSPSGVKLEVFDLNGRVIDVLVDGNLDVGFYSIPWTRAGATSGVYFYRLTITPPKGSRYVETKKMVLLR